MAQDTTTKEITVPTSFQRLETLHGDAIECPNCGDIETWGEWESDVSYDDETPVLLTQGRAMCKTCGYEWRL